MIQRERTTSEDRDERDDDQRDQRGSCRQPGCYLPPEHEEPCIITVLR